jgi:hypothetical protein
MFQVLAYQNVNLGDTMQTLALTRLLPLPGPVRGVFRHDVSSMNPEARAVINGWLGDPVPQPRDAVFAGIYIGNRNDEQLDWLRASTHEIGARDPYTRAYLAENSITSQIIGCATMTFERHHGDRSGRYAIDVGATGEAEGATVLTQLVDRELPWPDRWQAAVERLELLRRAEIVYTNRLHVALPCLAFGTPVVIRKADLTWAFQPPRLSLLEHLCVPYDVPTVLDITAFAEQYIAFLSRSLDLPIRIGQAKMPVV